MENNRTEKIGLATSILELMNIGTYQLHRQLQELPTKYNEAFLGT